MGTVKRGRMGEFQMSIAYQGCLDHQRIPRTHPQTMFLGRVRTIDFNPSPKHSKQQLLARVELAPPRSCDLVSSNASLLFVVGPHARPILSPSAEASRYPCTA
eukprot:scaffold1671_cov344-Pavlova_lutheri.AAC.6